MTKNISIIIDHHNDQSPLVDRIVTLLENIPTDMLKCSKGKIEIDWSDFSVVYKSTAHKNIT